MNNIIKELSSMVELFEENAEFNIVEFLSKNRKANIIGLGAGRMGYSLRAFIMRLGHLGYSAQMYGDTCIPPIDKDTIILINSSSGETRSILNLCQIAKEFGAILIAFTSNSSSSIHKIADYNVPVPIIKSSQPMKTINEQFSLIMFDHFANNLAKRLQVDIAKLHTNLE